MEHALGQVVEPLEPLPPRDHQLAVVPEKLEHLLGRLPTPHLALPRGAVEMPRAERPARPDLVEDVLAQVRDGSCRSPRTTAARPPASPAGTAASPRREAGMPRAPSTRSGARARAAVRPTPAGTRRHGSRARSGGSAPPSRSSRAERMRGAARPLPPRPWCPVARATRSPARRSPGAGPRPAGRSTVASACSTWEDDRSTCHAFADATVPHRLRGRARARVRDRHPAVPPRRRRLAAEGRGRGGRARRLGPTRCPRLRRSSAAASPRRSSCRPSGTAVTTREPAPAGRRRAT